MHRRQATRDPKSQANSRGQRPLQPMATPRKSQPPKKSGCLPIVFIFGITGGLIWLMMLIMGWGPYTVDEDHTTPTQTLISVIVLRGTPTATPTSAFTATTTPTGSSTQAPTLTPSPIPELMPFILIGEQENLSSALIRPGLGCDTLIIAGQVWDLQDAPIKGLQLHLSGALGGFLIDSFAVSGSATNYGESGYEFTLDNLRIPSDDTLFLQLLDAIGNPLSHPFSIQTFNDCQKNLILINFKQVR